MDTYRRILNRSFRSRAHAIACAAAGLVLALGARSPVFAQLGTVTGRVIDAETGESLSGVLVQVLMREEEFISDMRPRGGNAAISRARGEFRIVVREGRYSLICSLEAYEPERVDGVEVSADTAVSVGTVKLRSYVDQLNPLVVTASRTQERALDSPSSLYIVQAQDVEEQAATTIVDDVWALPGVDVMTTGISQHDVVARGFNSVGSGALFVLTDNRWSSVPSLRINAYDLIPVTSEEIDRIEFMLDPGSALYGPNVDRGVMHLITRSPLDYQGTTVNLSGGGHSGNAYGKSDALSQVSFRHAGLIGERLGYKLSGMYFNGLDWKYEDPAETVERDYRQERFSGDVRLDFRIGERGTLIVNGGASHLLSGIEMTEIGAVQQKDWTYSYAQARLRSGDLFAQAYVNINDSGDSFTLRDGELLSDNSLLYVGQVQHGLRLGAGQRFTYGADLIRTIPRTNGHMNGRNENADDITEVGAYLQSETRLSPKFDLVLGGRVDYHDVMDDLVLSPRAAIVFKPGPGHDLRITYNRAFSRPLASVLFGDRLLAEGIPNPVTPGVLLHFPIRVRGAPAGGFNYRRDCTNTLGQDGLCMRVPPQWWESGEASQPLPLDVFAIWSGIVRFVTHRNPSLGYVISQMNAPTTADVPLYLAMRDPSTGSFDAVTDVADVPEVKPMISNTFEVGYKGMIGNRLLLGVDVYYSQVEDFIGPPLPETPNVFADEASLALYLESEAARLGLTLTPQQIQDVAELIAQVPWGIVTPEEVDPEIQDGLDPTTIILTYRNYPKVDLWGADLGAAYRATDWLSFSASYSYMSENLFRPENLGTPTPLALNAPRNKASVGARLGSKRLGLAGGVRGRFVESFPVFSGVYVSDDARPPFDRSTCTDGTCVDSYVLFDVEMSYNISNALPIAPSTVVSVTCTNVFNTGHIETIGAPPLGRVWFMRLEQHF
jgi:outer membrane receptor for ferrienterochelin and colicins